MIKLLLHSWLFSSPSLAGVSQQQSVLSRMLQFLKKRYRGLKMKFRTAKILRARRDARRIRDRTDRWIRYLVICLFLILLAVPLLQCNGVKHIIQLEESTDHTTGDDGGKIKYKVIFGDKSQKE